MPFGRQLLQFQFEDYIRLLFGCHVDQLASSVGCQRPSLTTVGRIQAAFQRLIRHRTRMALLDCLIAAGCSNGESRWPVGHVVVFREGSQHRIYYLGAAQPKLILQVLEDQYGHPSMWMIGATAYHVPLQGGQSAPRAVESATVRSHPDPETYAWLEHREGQNWLNTPMHVCRQVGCTTCFLAQIKDFEYCPVHCSGQHNPGHLTHIVCVQDDTNTKLLVLGWIAPFSEHSKFWIFHVIRKNGTARVVEHTDFVALPAEISILSPCSACTATIAQNDLASQYSPLHEGWPFQDFRHFLIRTGGDQKHFERWLLSRASLVEMTRLGNLDNDTIYSIRKLFSHLIKATFQHTYKTPCPRHLSNVRDLAFQLIGTELHWKDIRLESLNQQMQLSSDRFQVLTGNPQLLRIERQECWPESLELSTCCAANQT